MATYQWIGVSGDWSTPADWSADAVPGPSDDVVMAAAGSYTVTITTSQAIGSVLLNDAGATLDIQSGGTLAIGGSLTAQSGTLQVDGGTLNAPSGVLGPPALVQGYGLFRAVSV